MVIVQKENQIHFIDTIHDHLIKQFHKAFENALDQPYKSVELHLSSAGGSVHAAEQIIGILCTSYKPVEAFIHNASVYGGYEGVASAASVIVSYCHKKYIDANATFLIHHARNAASGKIIYNDEDVLYWMQQTGQTFSKMEQYLKYETIIDSENALKDGFVDEILYSNYVLPL